MSDFDLISELDKHHIFDAIDAQPGQLRLNFADEMGQDITPDWAVGITSIVLAGMGGSALAADVIKNWLSARLSIPFEIVRGYSLPEYVGSATLVIASSSSGNTEETLSALEEAQKRNARIVIMTTGGKLLKIAEEKNTMLLKLPTVSQPRFGVFAGLRALTCLFEDMGIIGEFDARRELILTADWLDIEKSVLNLDNQGDDNPALAIAHRLIGKPTIIYAGQALRAAAYKWKIDINENAKQLAWYNVYPELNHNEFQGWQFPEKKSLQAISLESSLDYERIAKRQTLTKKLLKDFGYEPIQIAAQGQTHIKQILWTILYGDYVSAYLGILNGIDPTPVDMVEAFKKELG